MRNLYFVAVLAGRGYASAQMSKKGPFRSLCVTTPPFSRGLRPRLTSSNKFRSARSLLRLSHIPFFANSLLHIPLPAQLCSGAVPSHSDRFSQLPHSQLVAETIAGKTLTKNALQMYMDCGFSYAFSTQKPEAKSHKMFFDLTTV